jgi:hypothetical protein
MPLDLASAICASVGIALAEDDMLPPDIVDPGLGEPIVLCAITTGPIIIETSASKAIDNLQPFRFIAAPLKTLQRVHVESTARPAQNE